MHKAAQVPGAVPQRLLDDLKVAIILDGDLDGENNFRERELTREYPFCSVDHV